MGCNADATIAWGVELSASSDADDLDYDAEDYDEQCEARDALRERIEELYDLDEILGWTEECPAWPAHLMGVPLKDRDTDEYRAAQARHDDYFARRNAAVPVETDHYGTYDYTGHILIVKRTKTWADWGHEEVDPAKLAPPTESEIAALNKVLDHLEFTGDRTPRLYVFAFYG